MINNISTPLLGLNDVTILPAPITEISSRKVCNPYYSSGYLPLITAPMDTVIDENNWEIFDSKHILTVIPFTVNIETRLSLITKTFVSFSLKEFEHYFCTKDTADKILEVLKTENLTARVCVDIANGHMRKLLDLCTISKALFGTRLILMAGNIANPLSYLAYAKAGVDFVRVGIGGGSQCTTSANSGVHFPMATLLDSIKTIKNSSESDLKSYPLIVADGGFKNFDDIIKALALGADFVMIGKLFAQSKEACGPTIDNESKRLYRGMSTKDVQSRSGKKELKTAEGISSYVPILYTLNTWIGNFVSYLRSAMSYTSSFNLIEFKSKCIVCRISTEAREAYFK